MSRAIQIRELGILLVICAGLFGLVPALPDSVPTARHDATRDGPSHGAQKARTNTAETGPPSPTPPRTWHVNPPPCEVYTVMASGRPHRSVLIDYPHCTFPSAQQWGITER